jgi:hypothetical protein
MLSSLYSWLTPWAAALILVCLALMFLSLHISILQRFLQEHITAISWATSEEHFKAIMLLQTLQAQQPLTSSLASRKQTEDQ